VGFVKLLLVFLAGVAAVPSVAGAATWSPPVDVSSPSLLVDNPFVGFGASGAGLASWRWQEGVGNNATGGVRLATRAPSGTFAPELAGPDAIVPPVVYGRDRVVFLSEEAVTTRPRERDRIDVTFGRIGGNVGRRKRVDTAEMFRLPAVAASDAGKVAVAYVRSVRGKHRAAKLAIGSRRGFALSRIVSPSGGVNAVTTAVGPRGDVVVAWERDGRIEARFAGAGHRLGRLVRVGRGVKLGTQIRAAISPGGRVWIAWTSQLLTEGGANGPFTLRAATKATHSSKFAPAAQLLDRWDRLVPAEAGFDLALGHYGDAFIAWTGFDGKNFRARLAIARRAGAFNALQPLSQPGYDAVVRDLAVAPSGNDAIVVWSKLDVVGEVGDKVFAGYLSGDSYGGEEQVSQGDRARVPAVAFNPSTGHPSAVWSQREGPDGPGVPLANVRTFLRASTRTP
jgi:hypothetical protein